MHDAVADAERGPNKGYSTFKYVSKSHDHRYYWN